MAGIPTEPIGLDAEKSEELHKDAVADTRITDYQPLPDEIKKSPVYKRGVLKLDLIVVPACMILYLLSFIDKANIGNARVAGMQADLGLSDHQWSVVLTVLYPPYIVVELPAVLVLKHIGPHRLMPFMTFMFGIVCLCQGFVTNYGALLVCRFFLGLFEGGLIACLSVYLATIYRSEQYQVRAGMLFAGNSLAGAFSGLLAAAIVTLDGVHGRSGWSWIFIIEGAMTAGLALVAAIFLSADYEHAWWLSKEEKIILRQAYDVGARGAEHHGKFNWGEVRSALTSPLGWVFTTLATIAGVNIFGFSYFAPTIVRSFGYGPIETQLRSVPPYAVVFVCVMAAAYYSDRVRNRSWAFMVAAVLGMLGTAIQIGSKDRNARYAGVFFQAFGAFGPNASTTAWTVDNMSPYYKRATIIALSFGGTQIGGIISGYIYNDPPYYRTGASVAFGSLAFLFLCGVIGNIYIYRTNRARERELASLPPDFIFPEGPMDDKDVRFRYRH